MADIQLVEIVGTPSPSNGIRERNLTRDEIKLAVTKAITTPPAGRIPTSTYRVQFGEEFTFGDAEQRLQYLSRLGISDLYGSPYFHAHSAHGYDITNHNRLNPALGGEEAFAELITALRRLGMGHVMDVVPNHMGVRSSENSWWNDVLENGPSSPYASYFDIDWHPIKSEMDGQVLLPILGEQYGRVLEQGELHLRLFEGAFVLRYGEFTLPITPGTYSEPLELAISLLREQVPADTPALVELESIVTAIRYLPGRTEIGPGKTAERQREKEVIKRRIAEVIERSEVARAAIEDAITLFNGTPGEPGSFDRLDALLARQVYRLAYWRVAAEEINYRRFFDINDLAAIRMEQPDVFKESHQLIMRLVGEGTVSGLRIDHPDGLWDPVGYFNALQRAATFARARVALEATHGPLTEAEVTQLAEEAQELDPQITQVRPLYIAAEKIVEQGETLPTDWAIHGTTGYEFLNAVGGLFVDPSSEQALTQAYQRFTGLTESFDDLVYHSKLRILRTALASELHVLAHELGRLSDRNRRYRDFTLGTLTEALRHVIAAFPVYRTYINDSTTEVGPHDRRVIEKAVRLARRRNAELDPSLWEFLLAILLLNLPDTSGEELAEQRAFVMKFQQLTGPVMAKGLEDTAFYIYNRLISLNEVGGNPKVFGVGRSEFHLQNMERMRYWPHAMLTTSTHDTKRSEDVRARISALSEMPDIWNLALSRWEEQHNNKKREVEDEVFPSRNDEYLVYQSLIGAWPLEEMDEQARKVFVERMVAYMAKATKEAKVHTSWLNPNPEYDEALEHFIRAVLDDREFLEDFTELQRTVAPFGALNSLAQVVLKFASPGVPDVYQGNELWDFSLVDPDNRRPVDFDKRAGMLEALHIQAENEPLQQVAQTLTEQWRDGRIKMWVTERTLNHRLAHPDLYQEGEYQPLEATGPAAEHVVAFARLREEESVIAVVPRLTRRLLEREGADETSLDVLSLGSERWRDTVIMLPPGQYRNLYTGERFNSNGSQGVDEAFKTFPVALLEKDES